MCHCSEDQDSSDNKTHTQIPALLAPEDSKVLHWSRSSLSEKLHIAVIDIALLWPGLLSVGLPIPSPIPYLPWSV